MLLFFTLLFVHQVFSCNYQAIVQAEANKEVYGQFTFFNKTQGEVFLLKKADEVRVFNIVGTNCHLEPTILKTYLGKPSKEPLGETRAYFEGQGKVYYTVYGSRAPHVTHIERMVCSMGQCRG